jgi:hypothetical protein
LAGGWVVVLGGVPQGEGFDESMEAEAEHDAGWGAAREGMSVAMLDAAGEAVEEDLCEKACEDEGTDGVRGLRALGGVAEEFREEVQAGDGQEEGSGEGIEEADETALVNAEEEDRKGAGGDRREEKEKLHERDGGRCGV